MELGWFEVILMKNWWVIHFCISTAE